MTGKPKLDVGWSAISPKTGKFYKKPFAYTTQADSDLARECASMGLTWSDMLSISYLSDELKEVAERFIKDGYGDTMIQDHVK